MRYIALHSIALQYDTIHYRLTIHCTALTLRLTRPLAKKNQPLIIQIKKIYIHLLCTLTAEGQAQPKAVNGREGGKGAPMISTL